MAALPNWGYMGKKRESAMRACTLHVNSPSQTYPNGERLLAYDFDRKLLTSRLFKGQLHLTTSTPGGKQADEKGETGAKMRPGGREQLQLLPCNDRYLPRNFDNVYFSPNAWKDRYSYSLTYVAKE